MQRNATFIAALAVSLILPSLAFAADAEAGKTLYMGNCMSCHGLTGKGDGPVGNALTPKPRDFSKGEFAFDADEDGTKGTDADLLKVIKGGAAAVGGSPLMAPWGHLSDDDVANLIAFIRTLKE
jgi:mono/diheme cytochrome c family protein